MNIDMLLARSATVADPSTATLDRGRALLRAAPSTQPASRRPTDRLIRRPNDPKARRVGRPVGRRLVLTGIAAAVVAAAAAAPVISSLGGPPAARASAATVLRRAGAAAGAQPGGWPNAMYWHAVSTFSQGGSPERRREIWIGHHVAGVVTEPVGGEGYISLDEPALFPAGGTGLSWDDLYALPTEPDALATTLRAGIHGAGNGDDAELFVIVGDLLRESPAPPALRQALYEVAARVPGVELVGEVTDQTGRRGIAVHRDDLTYVVDPDDGRLLEEVEATFRATYLEQGPASSAPAATVVPPAKGDQPKAGSVGSTAGLTAGSTAGSTATATSVVEGG
jgi:hypothetical protein